MTLADTGFVTLQNKFYLFSDSLRANKQSAVMFLFVPRLLRFSRKSVTSRAVGRFSISWGATNLSEGREAFGACGVAGRTSADHRETWGHGTARSGGHWQKVSV